MLLKHIKSKKNNNIKFLSNFKNKGVIALTSVLVFVLSLGIISFVTKTNVVTYITERILKELGIYTTEVRSVLIESNDYNSPGSWHIDKSAKWTGFGKVMVTFNVNSIIKEKENYKDVILVLDVSGSMKGEKLDKVKSDAKELVTYLLRDSNNKVALITFDSTSTILSNFTNDKETLLAKIDSLVDNESTNYDAALLRVDEVMEGYTQDPNRDVVTLFLTDGYPNVNTPNQYGTYEMLKDKYPYMVIHGVQYEMGVELIESIKQVTDSAWSADKITLKEVLFEASVAPFVYEKFVVTDYINNDYYKVNSVDDIYVSMGSVSLSVEDGIQKIIWNLGDNSYMTGDEAYMTIKLSLKDEYLGSNGYYPTNKKEKVESKLPDESEEIVNSNSTPVLKNGYEVIYDTNAPDGCILDDISSEEHFVYENVTKKQSNLSCDGYLFKGWKIDGDDSKDIKKVNDDIFIMPAHNVTIRATWSKQSVVKSMDGTVHEKTTLYKVLQKAAEEGTYAKEYTGLHQDSMSQSGNQKIYYWYAENTDDGTAILDKNNVVFAGHCWQMIRTTDTGGVKMIYNGEVEDGKCLSTRGNHTGVVGNNRKKDLNGNYVYGTSYSYDETDKMFTLLNTENATWNDTTYKNLLGKYTCGTESDTCTLLYQVNSYDSSTTAWATSYSVGTSVHYSYIGNSPFNANEESLATVGYMFGNAYNSKAKKNYFSGKLEIETESVNQEDYNVIKNDETYPYEYDSATKMWNSTINVDYKTSQMEFSPFVAGDYYLTYNVSGLPTNSNMKVYVNNTLKAQMTGTDTSVVNLEMLATTDVIKVVFQTSNSSNNSVIRFSLSKKIGEGMDNRWLFGSSVEYKDGGYTLKDTIPIDLRYDYGKLKNNHYSCFDEGIKDASGEVKCTKVKYVYYVHTYSSTSYYIELENGTKIEDVMKEMLEANKYNSSIKGSIDAWYEMNMMDYSDYLEDTIFCNDRSLSSFEGWNPNGGDTLRYLKFKEDAFTNNLNCTNETDRFSVSNEKAKLKYKVGLMRKSEIELLNNGIIGASGNGYWTISPYNFSDNSFVSSTERNGYFFSLVDVSYVKGVRPAISLIPEIGYSSGDGSMENPYVVDLEI